MAEMKTFVFAVVFIVLFSTLIISIPTDLQGSGEEAPLITPIDPALLTDFAASEAFDTTDFVPYLTLLAYAYNLNSRDWICSTNGTAFDLNAKVYFLGFVWLGQLEAVRFKTLEGDDRSLSITFDEMELDAEDGIARYTLMFSESGLSAGSFIVYWNTTTYATPALAWADDALYFLHGVGITANTNVISLLIALLLLQLPDCPILISILLATPMWASIGYLIWFIIKESLPFV
jgi:hypothetical protein